MDELKLVFQEIYKLNKKNVISEINFSNREVNIEDFIDNYKIKRNIAKSNNNYDLEKKYNDFIHRLEIGQNINSLKTVKLAYIINDNYLKLYVFNVELSEIVSFLELQNND